MTDAAIKAALEASSKAICVAMGDDWEREAPYDLMPAYGPLAAAAIAAFHLALPGLTVAIVRSGDAVLHLGTSSRGSVMSGKDLASAVKRAAGGGDG